MRLSWACRFVFPENHLILWKWSDDVSLRSSFFLSRMPPIPLTRKLRRTFARTVTPSSVMYALPWPAGPFGVFLLSGCSDENGLTITTGRAESVFLFWMAWSDRATDRIRTRDDDLRLALEGAVIPGGLSSTYIDGVFSVCFHRSWITILIWLHETAVDLHYQLTNRAGVFLREDGFTRKQLGSSSEESSNKADTGVYVQSVQTSVTRLEHDSPVQHSLEERIQKDSILYSAFH